MVSSDKPSTELGERFPKSPDDRLRLRAAGLSAAKDLCAFVDRSPSPYHAAAEVAARLDAAGFRALLEREAWSLSPGDRVYVTRGGTIVAFVIGAESPTRSGFRLISAHTDSPNLRVKPNADVSTRGYKQVGVEIYGGVLLSTWLDRDLSIAGRVLCDRGSSVEARLVDLERPIARVPSLAIHLNRGVNTDGLVLNQQKHMAPIVGLGKEEGSLKRVLAQALDEKPDAILGYDLSLYATEKAAVAGLEQEFLQAARLDNLGSCHAATAALSRSAGAVAATRGIVLYDHEECGSRSAVGAGGTVLRDALRRLVEATAGREPQAFERAMAGSLLVSADMAHAIHPNYADQHEPQHAPLLNRGLVIKSNANQSYATDGASAASFERLCSEVGYAPQRFVVRSDLPCGSTVGPITAAALGVATVDVGAPMLSMHSCREMAGTLDVHLAIETFAQLFR